METQGIACFPLLALTLIYMGVFMRRTVPTECSRSRRAGKQDNRLLHKHKHTPKRIALLQHLARPLTQSGAEMPTAACYLGDCSNEWGILEHRAVLAAAENARQVKAEAVHVVLLHPVLQAAELRNPSRSIVLNKSMKKKSPRKLDLSSAYSYRMGTVLQLSRACLWMLRISVQSTKKH